MVVITRAGLRHQGTRGVWWVRQGAASTLRGGAQLGSEIILEGDWSVAEREIRPSNLNSIQLGLQLSFSLSLGLTKWSIIQQQPAYLLTSLVAHPPILPLHNYTVSEKNATAFSITTWTRSVRLQQFLVQLLRRQQVTDRQFIVPPRLFSATSVLP